MSSATLKAHFDGKHIVLDEPFAIPPNTALAVTVVALGERHEEREQWATAGARALAAAYGTDEPEYTLADLKS